MAIFGSGFFCVFSGQPNDSTAPLTPEKNALTSQSPIG